MVSNSPNYQKGFKFDRFRKEEVTPILISLVIYLGWLFLFVGFRNDHLYFIAFFLTMYLLHPVSRRMILSFVFFLLFWILYDSMRVIPNYDINPVHIIEPYNLEKAFFGIQCDDRILTPNEYYAENTNSTKDLLAGFFYLTWVPLPILYGMWLFFKDRPMLVKFSFAFLLSNIFGFVIYYMYPAAPPWYIMLHGNVENFNIPGNAANLMRFDVLVGSPIFQNMYNKNANVFAAIPSLHAAYPIILFYFGLKKKYKWLSVIFFIDVIGIWFAAVYSLHHYIIDLILGGFCAIFAIFAFELVNRRDKFQKLLNRFINFSAG